MVTEETEKNHCLQLNLPTHTGTQSTKCTRIQKELSRMLMDNTVECKKKQTEVTGRRSV